MLTLKNHPFAVETFFETSLVLTYAVAREELQGSIPECLELDTFGDRWGFVAVALVQTRRLRPKGFPGWLGNDFFLAGYRIFATYRTSAGQRLRGLYILKSETNRRKMSFFGNLFTHYNYTTTDIDYRREGGTIKVASVKSGLDIEVGTDPAEAGLPPGSPFNGWKKARQYAGPLPFTFTYNQKNREVLIIEGVRQNWNPAPAKVIKNRVGFLEQQGFKEIVLANAFVIHDIPYYWKKGRKETWQRPAEHPSKA